MSKAERHSKRLKMAAKTWGTWREILITPEIRNEAEHLKNVDFIYANGAYRVDVFMCSTAFGGVTHGIVTRHGLLEIPTPADMLRIKCELFGVEAEAVEIMPGGVTSTQEKIRHMWVMPESFKLPFGFRMENPWGDAKL